MAARTTASPVAVVGMHRTGTSMVTKVLHDAGLALAGSDAEELIDPADDNPEGFWENKAIVALNDDLLEAAGGSWDNPPDLLPQAVDDPRVAHLAERASEILAGLRAHERWGFKDPRTSLTAGFWQDLQPDLRFVVCVRNPLEVAMSLKRRNQNSYSLALELWERYYRELLATVPADRRLVSHFDAFFLDPTGEAARICEFAGLDPVRPQVRADLRHHTIDVTLAEAGLSPGVRSLYAELCAEAGLPQPVEAAADEGKVRRMVLDGLEARRVADLRMAHIKVLEAERVRDRDRIYELEHSWAHSLESLLKRAARKAATVRLAGPTMGGRQSFTDAAAAASPRARELVARLPEPAQDVLRKGRDAALVARSKRGTAWQAARHRLLALAERGPSLDQWRDAYVGLLDEHLTAGTRWAMVHPGTTLAARRLGPGSPTPFPDVPHGLWPDDDQALVAHLEALRYAGIERLVVPEGSRDWFTANLRLVDHVRGRYLEVADRPGAGIIFDLTQEPAEGARTLLAAVGSLAAGTSGGLAVLDWTQPGIARELPGTTTFRPRPGPTLPYLDATVDVVIADGSRDPREARRVAALGVITVDLSGGGALVTAVERRQAAPAGTPGAEPSAVILVPEGAPARWVAAIRDHAAVSPARRITVVEGAGPAEGAGADSDIVLVIEPGVVPLPGALAAAIARAADEPSTAVTGKVLRADGRLDAAGGFVFADRSTGAIGAGSLEVRAPWHELVRPVCWPVGLVAAHRDTWAATTDASAAGVAWPATAPDEVRGWLREWAAGAWAAGRPVRYEPDIVVVRVDGDGAEPATPWPTSAWQRVVDLRPPRPVVLDDGAWQRLLADDDVAAIRG